AAQAVIAIENTRLFNELRQRTDDLSESLQQQTATADVLKVISRSTFDLSAVLEALIESASRLCGAPRGHILQFDGECLRLAAAFGAWPAFTNYLETHPLRLGRGTIAGRAAFERRTIHVRDVLQEPDYELTELIKQQDYRTVLAVPMLPAGALPGGIGIGETELEALSRQHIELVETFADQAVIAIENVRLFDEVQARTEELGESLQQQTATADILNVISNSLDDTQPVFDAIVESGLKLFPGAMVVILLADGNKVDAAAIAAPDPAGIEALRRRLPIPLTREYMTSTAILDRRIVDVPDAGSPPPELAVGARNFLASGFRANTTVPMMRGEVAIGALSVARRAP